MLSNDTIVHMTWWKSDSFYTQGLQYQPLTVFFHWNLSFHKQQKTREKYMPIQIFKPPNSFILCSLRCLPWLRKLRSKFFWYFCLSTDWQIESLNLGYKVTLTYSKWHKKATSTLETLETFEFWSSCQIGYYRPFANQIIFVYIKLTNQMYAKL